MIVKCRRCGYKIDGDMILAARIADAAHCRSCHHRMVTIENDVLRCADCRQIMQADHVCIINDEPPPIYMVEGSIDNPPPAN